MPELVVVIILWVVWLPEKLLDSDQHQEGANAKSKPGKHSSSVSSSIYIRSISPGFESRPGVPLRHTNTPVRHVRLSNKCAPFTTARASAARLLPYVTYRRTRSTNGRHHYSCAPILRQTYRYIPKPMMASFKLTYVNYRGRAELIRFILSQAGIEFEDIRLNPEKWNEVRPSKRLVL